MSQAADNRDLPWQPMQRYALIAGAAVDDAALSAAIDAELLHAVERGQTACTVLILDALVRGLDSTVDEVLRIAHLRVATDQLCRADDVV